MVVDGSRINQRGHCKSFILMASVPSHDLDEGYSSRPDPIQLTKHTAVTPLLSA